MSASTPVLRPFVVCALASVLALTFTACAKVDGHSEAAEPFTGPRGPASDIELVAGEVTCDAGVTAAYLAVVRACKGYTNDTQIRTCKGAANSFLRAHPSESCAGQDSQSGAAVRVNSDSVRLVLQRLKELGY